MAIPKIKEQDIVAALKNIDENGMTGSLASFNRENEVQTVMTQCKL